MYLIKTSLILSVLNNENIEGVSRIFLPISVKVTYPANELVKLTYPGKKSLIETESFIKGNLPYLVRIKYVYLTKTKTSEFISLLLNNDNIETISVKVKDYQINLHKNKSGFLLE